MQNKYLLIADAHIHHEPQWRFDWLAKELAQLYDEYAHTHQLMLLGDVFEVRDRIDARAANLFLDTVIEWQKKNRVIWITGQHDSYVPGRATFEGLRGLRNGVRGVIGRAFGRLTRPLPVPPLAPIVLLGAVVCGVNELRVRVKVGSFFRF